MRRRERERERTPTIFFLLDVHSVILSPISIAMINHALIYSGVLNEEEDLSGILIQSSRACKIQ